MNMRILFYSIILAAVGLQSCSDSGVEKKPDGLIPEEKMAEIMVDVRLLEGTYAGDFQRVDSSEFNIESYYEQLFVKHNITRGAFLASSDYYALHPDELLRIETEVAKKLEVLSAQPTQ
jgi:hypothetical protein